MKKSLLALFLALSLLLSGCVNGGGLNDGSSGPDSQEPVPFGFDVLDKQQPHKILVLGNSFIWTSDVDGQLQELATANGISLEIKRHAVGYSQAAGHYQDIFVQQIYTASRRSCCCSRPKTRAPMPKTPRPTIPRPGWPTGNSCSLRSSIIWALGTLSTLTTTSGIPARWPATAERCCCTTGCSRNCPTAPL